jgi:hypothetical protein
MKNNEKETPLWVAKTALVFFVFFFVWTLLSGDVISPERKTIMLIFIGAGNLLLLIGIINNEN